MLGKRSVGCCMMCDLDHSPPVNHTVDESPMQEWPDASIWAQLQWETLQQSDGNPNYTSPAYLANLGTSGAVVVSARGAIERLTTAWMLRCRT